MQPMTHEHDTVVVDDGRESGSGMGAILGIIAIVVLLVAVWYFALGPGATSTGTTNNNTINNGGEQPAATQEIPNPVSS
jgi:predicted metalloprotease